MRAGTSSECGPQDGAREVAGGGRGHLFASVACQGPLALSGPCVRARTRWARSVGALGGHAGVLTHPIIIGGGGNLSLVPLGLRSPASPASSLISSLFCWLIRLMPLGLRSHASPASSPLVVAQRRGAGLAPWTYALSVASMSGSSFSAASRDISSACPMQVRVYIAQMSCVCTGGGGKEIS